MTASEMIEQKIQRKEKEILSIYLPEDKIAEVQRIEVV